MQKFVHLFDGPRRRLRDLLEKRLWRAAPTRPVRRGLVERRRARGRGRRRRPTRQLTRPALEGRGGPRARRRLLIQMVREARRQLIVSPPLSSERTRFDLVLSALSVSLSIPSFHAISTHLLGQYWCIFFFIFTLTSRILTYREQF